MSSLFKAKCFTVLIVSLLTIFTDAYSLKKVQIRINNPDPVTASSLLLGNYDIAAYNPGIFIDVVIPERDADEFISDYKGSSLFKDEDQIKTNLLSKKEAAGYRSYEETLAELQQIESDHGDICRLYNIGSSCGNIYSTEGNSNYNDFNHNIWALKLSDNVDTEEDEPSFYFVAAHHAREVVGTEIVMELLNHMVSAYTSDPEMQDRINNSQIWFVPIVNPDGRKIVLSETDVWWRKNIRDNDLNSAFTDSLDGVDPNRNYDFWWGYYLGSQLENSDGYAGPEPFSEPETQAIKSLIDSRHFVAGISFHSAGEKILYPFSYEESAIPDDLTSISQLAINMSLVLPATYSDYYLPMRSYDWYAMRGTLDDYSYGEHGTFAYTIETNTEFIPDYTTALETCTNNINASMILLDRIKYSVLTGLVHDQTTSSPVEAEIFVEGIDDTGAYKKAYVSDREFGRYYRMLEPGTYNISFSAFGYEDQTLTGITISSESETILDINMIPALKKDISGNVTDALTGDPVENAEIYLTDDVHTITDASGDFSFGQTPYGIYNIEVRCENYQTIYSNTAIDSDTSEINFSLTPGIIETFETCDFSRYNWSFGGNNDWMITSFEPFSGKFCARSGSLYIYQGSSSIMLTETLLEDGTISFYVDLNGAGIGDNIKFYIDDELKETWTRASWKSASHAVTSGDHIFKWEFNKTSEAEEPYACIDNIILPKLLFTGIENEGSATAADFVLYQNYPNPFNPETTIEFNLKENYFADLCIYNIKGELVANPYKKNADKGFHKIIFNGIELNSGIYFISLTAGGVRKVKPMLLIK